MADNRPRNDGSRRTPHPLAQKNRPQSGQARRKPPRPLPPGEQFFTPGATGLRKTVETRAAPLLVFFYQLPKVILPIVLVVFLLIGFAVTDWRGGLATLPVIAFVGGLAYLSWPSLGTGGRLLRLAVVAFLVAVAVTRFGGF
ncbi:DUF6703 family protein [Herbidospora mongoliensis]|uniref:DUF6703 family protein n=1 Tax=Herbidospora mongoliensis TaxID=688067 RepID=UPI0009FFF824|nr:DUF6703 family protein [Herbidospora mongoliensis]